MSGQESQAEGSFQANRSACAAKIGLEPAQQLATLLLDALHFTTAA